MKPIHIEFDNLVKFYKLPQYEDNYETFLDDSVKCHRRVHEIISLDKKNLDLGQVDKYHGQGLSKSNFILTNHSNIRIRITWDQG